MRGGERLTQRAVVEGVHCLVGQVGQSPVAEVVGHARLLQPLGVQFGIGDDLHLYLVHDSAKVGVEAGVEDVAKVMQIEALLNRRLADADPRDVTLTHVLETGGCVDKVVELPLQHRLEIQLHLAASHLDQNSHIHRAADLHILKVGADDLDLAILHLVHWHHTQVLVGAAVLAAELDPHVGPAHDLTLEGGAVSDGNRYLGDLDLDATHLDAPLHQFGRPLLVGLGVNLVPRHRDDVLVARHAGGQDFGHDGVGDDRETIGEHTCAGGILEIVQLPQHQRKGKDTELVIEQNISPLTTFHAAKGQRCPRGKASRVDGGDRVPAEGDDVGIIPHVHPFLPQLVNDGAPVDVAGEKDEDIALLEFPDDGNRGLIRAGRTDDGGKARHTAVHQLDAPRAQLNVVNRAVEVTVTREIRILGAADQL